jgi:hypothetical protein
MWTFTTGPVGALDHFLWTPIQSPQSSGQPFEVTLTAKDERFNTITSFDQAVDLSARSLEASPALHLLEAKPYTAFATFKQQSVGYAFTPNSDLWVHALRSFSGGEVSLWSDSGVRLARVHATNQVPQWTETALPETVHLQAGRTYRISAFSELPTLQYARFEQDDVFAHGTFGESYEGSGNGFPNQPHPARWWFIDLAYRTGEPVSFATTPATTTAFQNGQWTGTISLSENSPSLVLRATYGKLVSGSSGPFLLELSIQDTDHDGMPDQWEIDHGFLPDDDTDAAQDEDGDGATNLAEYKAGTDPRDADSVFRLIDIRLTANQAILQFSSVSGWRYRVEKSDAPFGQPWRTVSENLAGNGVPLEVIDGLGSNAGQAYYRVVLTGDQRAHLDTTTVGPRSRHHCWNGARLCAQLQPQRVGRNPEPRGFILTSRCELTCCG